MLQNMKTLLLPLSLLLVLLTSARIQAHWDDTVAYVRQLLREGRPVALLVIDMQTQFKQWFSAEEYDKVSAEQIVAIQALVDEPNLHIIDINWAGEGSTLPELHFAMKRSARYRQIFKVTDDAFVKFTVPKNAGEDVITESLASFLKKQGVSDIVPTGCFDAACVMETAKGALKNDFRVAFDQDLNISVDYRSVDFWLNRSVDIPAYKAEKARLWEELTEANRDIIQVPKEQYNFFCNAS